MIALSYLAIIDFIFWYFYVKEVAYRYFVAARAKHAEDKDLVISVEIRPYDDKP